MSVTFLLCFSISILLPCYVYMLNTDTDTDILYEKLTFSKKECSRDWTWPDHYSRASRRRKNRKIAPSCDSYWNAIHYALWIRFYCIKYSMHCSLCIVFYALYYMHNILCIILYAFYSMHCIQCIVFNALYYMPSIIYIIFYALYSMPCILGIEFYTLYSMYCIVFYSLYSMHCILPIVF